MRPNQDPIVVAVQIGKTAWSFDLHGLNSGTLVFGNVYQPIDLNAAQKHGGLIQNGVFGVANVGLNYSICLGNRIGSCYL
jgi:hypothetical protein